MGEERTINYIRSISDIIIICEDYNGNPVKLTFSNFNIPPQFASDGVIKIEKVMREERIGPYYHPLISKEVDRVRFGIDLSCTSFEMKVENVDEETVCDKEKT